MKVPKIKPMAEKRNPWDASKHQDDLQSLDTGAFCDRLLGKYDGVVMYRPTPIQIEAVRRLMHMQERINKLEVEQKL